MASQGPTPPGTVAVEPAPDGVFGWAIDGGSENNIKLKDEGGSAAERYAISFLSDGSEWTNALVASNFGFTLPTSTIDGVEVVIEGSAQNVGRTFVGRVWLANNGTQLGTIDTTINNLTETDQSFTYGGPTSKWGATLTQTIINSSTFQVWFQVGHVASSGATSPYIDYVTAKVYYTEGSGATGVVLLMMEMFGE
jgi:hypothetical protein